MSNRLKMLMTFFACRSLLSLHSLQTSIKCPLGVTGSSGGYLPFPHCINEAPRDLTTEDTEWENEIQLLKEPFPLGQ